MAKFGRFRKPSFHKINYLDVAEWQNYVSPDIPCKATHSSATSDRTLPFSPHFLHPAPRPISMILISLFGKIRADLQIRRRRRLFLLICHVANADGGEAMLFDNSGAARNLVSCHCVSWLVIFSLSSTETTVFMLLLRVDIGAVAANLHFVREAAFGTRSIEWPLLNQRSLHIKPLQGCSRFVMVVQSNPWLRKLSVLILV
ncbi:hypothetical protein [Ruegeria atlantica]|uniref:hypothetical protein n=1 Tax=Ruegeria atlantica TaxID=81569 RepID=UPI00147E6E02|nr:hypothetical protein [Ruegeria atlantica]